MKLISFGTVVVTLLFVMPGCTDRARTGTGPPEVEPVPPNQAFPALSRPGVIFDDPGKIYGFSIHHGGILESRYVLYPDRSFALQFSSPRYGFSEQTGIYFTTDSVITFEFDNRSGMAWVATGTIDGDALTVRYNDVMMWTDFIDGVYVRSSEE